MEVRVKPSGCWNKIILSIPLKHPHEVKRLLSWGNKKIDFERIIEIPSYISRSNNDFQSTNNWKQFRNRSWGCTWNPEDKKVKQSIDGEKVKTKFWTTDVPIGILLRLKLQRPDLVFGGHSMTYIQTKYHEVDKESWRTYLLDSLNQFNDKEKILELITQLKESYLKDGINDLSILFDKEHRGIFRKELDEKDQPSYTLEKFFT